MIRKDFNINGYWVIVNRFVFLFGGGFIIAKIPDKAALSSELIFNRIFWRFYLRE